MLKLILLLTSLAGASDLFAIDCAKYLIQPDPKRLERESVEDLTLLSQTLKARHFLYGHPLDLVWSDFIETELKMRGIAEEIRGRALDEN